jgi:hypothetical protein
VIEQFGFSPRVGDPDAAILAFASRLHRRKKESDYVTAAAYRRYLADNPNNEHRSVFPVDFSSAQDGDDPALIAKGAVAVQVRGRDVAIPPAAAFATHGIGLSKPPRIQVFELCRFLAATARDQVLATSDEQRVSVPPELRRIFQLDEWHHPDVVSGERPSQSPTFRRLAEVLTTGDVNTYEPDRPPNTHWSNWSQGGSL